MQGSFEFCHVAAQGALAATGYFLSGLDINAALYDFLCDALSVFGSGVVNQAGLLSLDHDRAGCSLEVLLRKGATQVRGADVELFGEVLVLDGSALEFVEDVGRELVREGVGFFGHDGLECSIVVVVGLKSLKMLKDGLEGLEAPRTTLVR